MENNRFLKRLVYLGTRRIDEVYFLRSISRSEVRDSLVNHDGYDARILVLAD